MRIEIHEMGDWENTLKRLKRLGYDLEKGGRECQLKLGKKLAGIVKGHLKNQDLTYWQPLEENYLKRRNREYNLRNSKMLYRT